MKHSFVLNERSKDGETVILFTVYFKKECRKFVYSTGEKIHPNEWDFENKTPNNLQGRKGTAQKHREIHTQLSRYPKILSEIASAYKLAGETLTIDKLRQAFDHEFKKERPRPNSFAEVCKAFTTYKKKEGEIKLATMKRYKNLFNLLLEFEQEAKYKLTFARINNEFYLEFMDFCRTKKRHTQNTLGRNIGALKSFMNWAYQHKYHYNMDFLKFKKMSAETNEVTLTREELNNLWRYDFSKNPRLEKVRDLFYFGCATGMRYSDYSKITKANVHGDYIILVVTKSNDPLRIPMNDYSRYILKKYHYNLPTISEQKFRDYIKEACQIAGIDQPTIKTQFIGAERIDEELPKYARVSSHTARRTFITLSLENGMRPEVVKSVTGHKNLQSFAKYVKVNPEAQKMEMNQAWKMEYTPLKIAQ